MDSLKEIFKCNPVNPAADCGIKRINDAPTYSNLGQVLSAAFNLVFILAGFLALFWMVWGAFEYIFAGGDKEKLGKARTRITFALVGFLLLVVGFAVKSYVEDIFPQVLPRGDTRVTFPTPKP